MKLNENEWYEDHSAELEQFFGNKYEQFLEILSDEGILAPVQYIGPMNEWLEKNSPAVRVVDCRAHDEDTFEWKFKYVL